MLKIREMLCCVVFVAPAAVAQVVTYEADVFPEEAGWLSNSVWCTPERWIENGWFVQRVQPGECAPPPDGDRDAYTRWIGGDFGGEPTFFLEWRLQANGDRSEIPWAGPSHLSLWCRGAALYWFAIARDQVKFTRDHGLGLILFVDIEPDVPHTFRLELYDVDGEPYYDWYIDTELISSDVPAGPFPSETTSINWQAQSASLESTVRWDYIRYGRTPQDASGDYDSDQDVDWDDYYFFEECYNLSGVGVNAGPGCRFADFDLDTDVDCYDSDQFRLAWTAPEDPPALDSCCEEACCATTADCADGDACTQDECDPDNPESDDDGCLNTRIDNGGACDDGEFCTIDDQCMLGVCAGTPSDDGEPCDDGEFCTIDDQCIAGVCAGTYQERVLGDLVPRFCPPDCPQPDIDDILCLFDDFADGATPNGCTAGGPGVYADLAPCAGNGSIDIDDVLAVLDAFAQAFAACPTPCP